MNHIIFRIEKALAQVRACNSDRGRMVRRIYLDKEDMAEWLQLDRGFEYMGFEIGRIAYSMSAVYNKCGQAFRIAKLRT